MLIPGMPYQARRAIAGVSLTAVSPLCSDPSSATDHVSLGAHALAEPSPFADPSPSVPVHCTLHGRALPERGEGSRKEGIEGRKGEGGREERRES
eukprot:632721-Rhodomonas_salina.1